MSIKSISALFRPPYKDYLIDNSGLLTRPWELFFRFISAFLEPLGVERYFPLENNISTAKDITGLNFNSDGVSQAIVEFFIQRVTTGAGATELIERGTFAVVYKPTSNTWDLVSLEDQVSTQKTVNIVNNQAAAADVSGLIFNSSKTNQAVVDYLIRRVTTSTGAVELVESGTFHLVYKPTSNTWSIVTIGTPGPSSSGVTLTVNSSGQVRYTSSNITGTASISDITFRSRSFSSKSAGITFSITASGQVQYTSTNITGTASISKVSYRARTISGKSSTYSAVGR